MKQSTVKRYFYIYIYFYIEEWWLYVQNEGAGAITIDEWIYSM